MSRSNSGELLKEATTAHLKDMEDEKLKAKLEKILSTKSGIDDAMVAKLEKILAGKTLSRSNSEELLKEATTAHLKDEELKDKLEKILSSKGGRSKRRKTHKKNGKKRRNTRRRT